MHLAPLALRLPAGCGSPYYFVIFVARRAFVIFVPFVAHRAS
jgi:hypothetical protein